MIDDVIMHGIWPFLTWGDFHTCSCFARSAIPEEKWGLLIVYTSSGRFKGGTQGCISQMSQ